jgi:cell division protein ZapA
MAQVTLRINGYAYVLGCADGEEAHLQAMANEVDERIATIRQQSGTSGEARMLLMAALTLADDLYEHRRGEAKPAPQPNANLGRKLNRLAKRAEDIAADLETP